MVEFAALLLLCAGLSATPMLPIYYANALVQRGKTEQALLWYQNYYRLMKRVPNWRGVLALNICACHINLGDFLSALPHAEKAIEELKRDRLRAYLPLAKACLGVIQTRLGEFEAAEVHFQELLAEKLPKPYQSVIRQYAAIFAINVGRMEEAERLLTEALEGERANSDLRLCAENNRALVRYYQGELEAALEISERIARSETRIPWIQTYLQADLLAFLTDAGRLEEARQLEAKLLPLLPNLPMHCRSAACRAVAKLALRSGDYERARAYAEQALSLDANPNALAGAWLIQAEVFLARQNRHRAATLCEEILRSRAMEFYKRKAAALLPALTGGQSLPDSPLQRGGNEEGTHDPTTLGALAAKIYRIGG